MIHKVNDYFSFNENMSKLMKNEKLQIPHCCGIFLLHEVFQYISLNYSIRVTFVVTEDKGKPCNSNSSIILKKKIAYFYCKIKFYLRIK